jgi:hypothetical protein
MSKVNYDIDFDSLSPEEFSYFLDCVDEAAVEDGCTKEEILNNQDILLDRYKDEACEKYHFGNQKLGKTLRCLQNIDVYEVTESGAINFFNKYTSRFHMSMDLKKIYKLDSAFAFCPDKALGYVIHGNVSKAKEYLDTLIFLYKEREQNLEEVVR